MRTTTNYESTKILRVEMITNVKTYVQNYKNSSFYIFHNKNININRWTSHPSHHYNTNQKVNNQANFFKNCSGYEYCCYNIGTLAVVGCRQIMLDSMNINSNLKFSSLSKNIWNIPLNFEPSEHLVQFTFTICGRLSVSVWCWKKISPYSCSLPQSIFLSIQPNPSCQFFDTFSSQFFITRNFDVWVRI